MDFYVSVTALRQVFTLSLRFGKRRMVRDLYRKAEMAVSTHWL